VLKKRCLSICLIVLSIVILTLSTAQTNLHVIAASPPSKTLTGYIPSAVMSGQARLVGPHAGADQLALAIGLPLRNAQALTQFLNEASTPRNPHYRHYLTLAQENQAFNPTVQQEHQVIAWLQANGLTVTHTYPNHLLVDTLGTFSQVERLLHIILNDYTTSLDRKTISFYAPATEPTVPGSVSSLVSSIVGLDTFPVVHADNTVAHPTFTNGNAHGQPPYYPQDFANAYDINPLWKLKDTGSNQHIGITYWGTPPSDPTLIAFAIKTLAKVATKANKRLQAIQVPCPSGCYYNTLGGIEAGMDVESSSGMAPGATIDYYQVPTDQQGNPTTTGLENALNQAGSDVYDNQQISNSWSASDDQSSGCEATSISDPFMQATEQILQSNTATGHDYFFSSGDTGSACAFNSAHPCKDVHDPYPSYPASSAYVTSVGGTNLSIQNNRWQSEVAWKYGSSTCFLGRFGHPPIGSGGGYSNLFSEPSWQFGIPDPYNQRGYPDISADADKRTGAYICYDVNNGYKCTPVGGTSLATPLWAGMLAVVNQYVQSQNEPSLGFINPLLYEINTGMPYTAYHDIKMGTNGKYQAGSGWDAVTGLGSPDLYNLALDAASLYAYGYASLAGTAAVSATDVWAVGSLNSNGSVQTLIEHWNGVLWYVVPSPNFHWYESTLYSVTAVSATDVWAVGYYRDIYAGSFYTLIERWNGTSWTVVPSPNPGSGQDDMLYSVTAVSATDAWAVGYYSDSNRSETLTEHWNGSNWTVIPSPSPGSGFLTLYSVAEVSATDVWAVGFNLNPSGNNYQTLIEQWNGTSWTVVPSPSPGSGVWTMLNGVTVVSATDIWAVGYYSDSNSDTYTLIEHWDGSSWTVAPSPNPPSPAYLNGLNSVMAVSATDVWAVGNSTVYGGNALTLIEHWNGTNWTVVPSPSPVNQNMLNSVTSVSATDVWAVGNSGNVATKTLIEQWNGTSWTVFPSP